MQGVGAMRGLTQGPGLFARMLKRMHKSWHGYVFIAPAMTIIIIFAYIAMIFSLYVSFHRGTSSIRRSPSLVSTTTCTRSTTRPCGTPSRTPPISRSWPFR